MKIVSNQKLVTVEKQKCDKNNLYATVNLEAIQQAMNNLKGEAFKLWMYLAKNQNNYTFALSQKDAESWGIKKDAYYSGVNKLIEEGYLIQEDNKYTFSEKPKNFSEKQKNFSEKPKNFSEKPQRNITDITKNNTNNNTDVTFNKQLKQLIESNSSYENWFNK